MLYYPQEEDLVRLLRNLIGLPARKYRIQDFLCGQIPHLGDFIVAKGVRGQKSCTFRGCVQYRQNIPNLYIALQQAYCLTPSNNIDADSLITQFITNKSQGCRHSDQLKLDAVTYVVKHMEQICANAQKIHTSKSNAIEKNICAAEIDELLHDAYLCARLLDNIYVTAPYWDNRPPTPAWWQQN